MEKGLILINTGPGKGKTTAALGTTIRALGQGFKVAFLQFIKNQETGESRFLKQYSQDHSEQIHYARYGLGFVMDHPSEADRAKAKEALGEAEKLFQAGYDLIVLDEICVALSKGLLDIDQVLKLLRSKPETLNVILTGRGCPEALIDLADTVTEMVLVKHAFDKGIPAKKGLEF